jgi:hypothetical protein
MNEPVKTPVQELWQAQPVEETKMSVAAIHLRAGKFERRISRRNLRETIGAVAVVIVNGYFLATASSLAFRVAWGLFIAGMIWMVIELWRRATPRAMPADAGASTCLAFFRSELERQRDLVREIWTWYLIPLLPGYAALNVAIALTVRSPRGWAGLALADVFFVAMFFVLWKLNARAARCLQRSIDDLDANK